MTSDDPRLQYPGVYMKQPAPPPPPSRRCPRQCCCYCPTKLSSSACTCFGVCILVLGYTLLGAFTFMAVEGGFGHRDPPPPAVVLGDDIRAKTVEKLWSITEDLNILYKDNWTRLAAQEVLKFQDTLVRNLRGYGSGGAAVIVKSGNSGGGSMYYNHHHHRWSFSSSFLYSLTLITTIGYGSVAPRTAWGKLITIIYALIGIPLMLVYLSTVGEVLARSFRRLYARLFCSNSNNNNKHSAKSKQQYLHHNNVGHCLVEHPPNKPEHVRVPISLCLLIIVLYICAGAFLFNKLENWSFLEGSYFCFTSLGTIGFGDLVPGLYHSYQIQYQSSASTQAHALEQVSIFASSAYILLGMALIAMCFNLVQDEVVILARHFAKYFGTPVKSDEDVVDDGGGDGGGVAMTAVSATSS